MLSDSSAMIYFSSHLMAEKLAGFSAAEKQSAVKLANLDVASLLGREVNDDDPAELVAAVCEEAIHLLFCRDTLYEDPKREIASEKIDGLGSRSYRRNTARTAGVLSGRARELVEVFLSGSINLKRG